MPTPSGANISEKLSGTDRSSKGREWGMDTWSEGPRDLSHQVGGLKECCAPQWGLVWSPGHWKVFSLVTPE